MKSQLLIAVAVILSLCLLSACALLRDHENGARLAVQYATLKVIDGDADKAAKVLAIAAEARGRLTSPQPATLAALDVAVRSQIPWGSLDAADRLLVDSLLGELRAELQRRFGTGELDSGQRLQVVSVIAWIERAAQLGG